MPEFLFASIRLSSVGLAGMLGLVVVIRTLAMFSREFPTLKGSVCLIENPVRPLGGSPLLTISTIIALIPLVAFYPGIIEYFVGEPAINTISNLLVGWLVCAAMLFLIDRIAFDRAFKVTWALGWIAFAHGLGMLGAFAK